MNTSYHIRYSPESLTDLRNILYYISEDLGSLGSARKVVSAIKSAVSGLKTMPFRHERLDWEPWASKGIRRLVVQNYLVLYLVQSESHMVGVVRIVYAGRSLERIAEELARDSTNFV